VGKAEVQRAISAAVTEFADGAPVTVPELDPNIAALEQAYRLRHASDDEACPDVMNLGGTNG
jgi:hypothetical protein